MTTHTRQPETVPKGGNGVDRAGHAPGMMDKLGADKLWAGEYEDYVDAVSFGRPDERIGFSQALAAVRGLVERLGAESGR